MAKTGGKRPGSGRKPIEPFGRDVAFRMYPSHMAKIQKWRKAYGLKSNAEALRQLVEVGWEHSALRQKLSNQGSESKKPCQEKIWHGPGHQSSTRCRLTGEHDVHEAIYGEFNQYAEWRADGRKTFTGAFDEPPRIGE